MSQPVGIDLDFLGVAAPTGLRSPTAASDAATKAYVDSAIEGLAWKDSARVATQANINLSAPGAAIDGVTLANGDRVLVMSQTTTNQNGVYVFSGSATAMTRSFDAQTANDLEAATLTVEEGTSAGSTYRQAAVNFTLGTDPVTFTSFGTSVGNASTGTAGKVQLATQAETDTGTDAAKVITPATLAGSKWAKKKYATTIGDGSATSFTVTHNVGTTDVLVQVFETGGSKRQALVETRITDANTATIVFSAAPAANAYRVVVVG